MVGVPQYAGRQKLYSALLILACQPGPIDERLETAYRMAISSIEPHLDIPPEFKAELQLIRQELHNEFMFQSRGSGNGRRQWAAGMATRIVALYDKLARAQQ